MKRMKRVWIPLSVVAILIGLVMTNRSFTQVGSQRSNEPAQSQIGSQDSVQKVASDKEVVIGYLQGRDNVVTIIRSPKGTVYTIKSKNGKTLAAKLSEKELQAKFPAVYDQVKYGLAGNDATIRQVKHSPAGNDATIRKEIDGNKGPVK